MRMLLWPQVDKNYAERQALAARHRKKGWDEERISNEVYKLKEEQLKRQDRCDKSCLPELGGLDQNAIRFFNNLVKVGQVARLFSLLGCLKQY